MYEVEKALLENWESLQDGHGDTSTRNDTVQIDKEECVRKGLLDAQDRYGNTLLHVAAWNDKTAIYDRLIQLGANARINNRDVLTPFTLTARLGIWNSFNHI